MPEAPNIRLFAPRGQCIILLLAALNELAGSVTKQEALSFIAQRKWFAIEADDLDPYPSQVHTTHEPRWKTVIAWARKDAILLDFMLNVERDAWALSPDGRRRWERAHGRFAAGELDVRKAFLWSPVFKKYLRPQYEPGTEDAKRPLGIYRDRRRWDASDLLEELGIV